MWWAVRRATEATFRLNVTIWGLEVALRDLKEEMARDPKLRASVYGTEEHQP